MIFYNFLEFLFVIHFCLRSQNAVSGLQEINKLKSNVQDIHVPLEVFE